MCKFPGAWTTPEAQGALPVSHADVVVRGREPASARLQAAIVAGVAAELQQLLRLNRHHVGNVRHRRLQQRAVPARIGITRSAMRRRPRYAQRQTYICSADKALDFVSQENADCSTTKNSFLQSNVGSVIAKAALCR